MTDAPRESAHSNASPLRALRGLRGAALGALAGAAATALVATLVASRQQPPATAPLASFDVQQGAVRLRPGAVPLAFDTVVAELGAPLARAPVTARVATIESRTGLSFAPLDGRVVSVAVHIGDRVKEGDRIALVRSGELATMHRELHAAELTMKTKQALADRLRLLIESRAASQNDLLVAESEIAEARLSATAADAKIASLQVRAEGDAAYWVLAHKSGIVVQLDAAAGKQVGPERDQPLATVADLDEVLVVGDVPSRDVGGLTPGMTVAVAETGGPEVEPGVVETVSDVLDPDRQTVPLRIRAANKGYHLRPGEFVVVTFPPRADDRVLQVPREAVVSDGAQSVVFVETEPGVLRRKLVQVGRQTKERAEILGGIAPGDRVVVRGALLLLNAIGIQG